jgi:hypothetical protein
MLRDRLNRDTLPILLPSALAVTLMIGGVAVMLVPERRTYIKDMTLYYSDSSYMNPIHVAPADMWTCAERHRREPLEQSTGRRFFEETFELQKGFEFTPEKAAADQVRINRLRLKSVRVSKVEEKLTVAGNPPEAQSVTLRKTLPATLQDKSSTLTKRSTRYDFGPSG